MKWLKANLVCCILAPLVFCLALLWPGLCSAEQVYQVTEAELTRLETNIAQLANINRQQKSMLKQARFDLEELSTALTGCKQELIAAKLSLAKANKLLAEYEAAEKSRRLRIKKQRNLGYTIAGILLAGVMYERGKNK